MREYNVTVKVEELGVKNLITFKVKAHHYMDDNGFTHFYRNESGKTLSVNNIDLLTIRLLDEDGEAIRTEMGDKI